MASFELLLEEVNDFGPSQIITFVLWGLECSSEYTYATTLLKTLQMIGVLVGATLGGQLADIFGRRKVLFGLYTAMTIAGFASAFANSWQLYTVTAFRFVIGAFTGGTLVVNFVLPLEVVGNRWRTLCGCLGFWAVGVAILPLLAYLLPDWRHLSMAVSLGGIPLIFTYWWVYESPRWLIQKGRYDEASAVITKMAIRNKRSCTLLNSLVSMAKKDAEAREAEKEYSYWDLFRTPRMSAVTCILLFAWFTSGCVYYGTTFSIEHLSGNRYLNVFFSGIVELPSFFFIIAVNNKIGRRWTTGILMSVAGVSCYGLLITKLTAGPKVIGPLTTILAQASKLGIAGAWGATSIASAEQFPTVVRNIGIGLCSMCARIGSIAAPQIVQLGEVSIQIPYIIYGTLAIISAFSFMFIAETLNKPLADSLPEWNCLCLRERPREEDEEAGESKICLEEKNNKLTGSDLGIELLSHKELPSDSV